MEITNKKKKRKYVDNAVAIAFTTRQNIAPVMSSHRRRTSAKLKCVRQKTL